MPKRTPARTGESAQTANPKPISITVTSRTGHAYRKAGLLFGPQPQKVAVTAEQLAVIEGDPWLTVEK